MAGKRQVSPSLADVASSADRLTKLSVTEDQATIVLLTLAGVHTSAIATADAAADARHEASVRRAHFIVSVKDVARISALPFPASVDKAADAKQLTRSVKAATSNVCHAKRRPLCRGATITHVGTRVEPLTP